MLSIGLSLISVGVGSFGGGKYRAKYYGSIENLLIALFVLVVILKHGTSGMLNYSCILIGIICGYIVCMILPMFVSTTGISGDGTEFVKSWVLDWSKVAEASWFASQFHAVKPDI